MSQKTTVVLLVLLALAAGYTLCWHYGWLGLGEKTPQKSRQGEALLAKPPADLDVVRVRLTRPGKPDLLLESKADQWVLVEPAAAEADRAEVTDLMAAFKTLKIAAVYTSGAKGAPADEVSGLNAPQAVLTLTDKDDKRYTLTVGRVDRLTGRSYVRLDDDATVYLVDRDVTGELDVGPAKLRSKKIWDLTREQIRNVVLSNEKGKMTLAEKDGRWLITAPIQAPADATEVSNLLGGLAGLRAESWVEDNLGLGAYGLTNPRITAEMTVQTGGTTTQPETETRLISFGVEVRDRSETFARLGDEQTVFAVPSSSVSKINVAVDDLRDKKLVEASPGDVVGVTLSDPKGEARLLKDANRNWQMVAPIADRGDDTAIEDWLRKVTELKADSFDDRPGLLVEQAVGNPQLRITLDRGPDKPKVELIVGQPSAAGATIYLKNAAYPSVALVAAERLKDVLVAPLSLADKSVLSLREDRIKRIARTGQGADRTVERIADDWQKWQLVAPARIEADEDAVKALLAKFKDLKATGRTLLKPGEVGLDKPAVTLTFTVLEAPPKPPATQPASTQPAEDIEVPHALALAKKDDKLYGHVAPSGAVYELNPALMDDATAELARRAIVGKLQADQAVFLIIEPAEAAKKVDLSRQGGAGEEWKLRNDATVAIDKIKVEEVINNLADLKVVRYVAFQAGPEELAKYGLDKPASKVTAAWPGADGRKVELLISAKGEEGAFYATVSGEGRVGLVNPSELQRVRKDWKFFEKSKS